MGPHTNSTRVVYNNKLICVTCEIFSCGLQRLSFLRSFLGTYDVLLTCVILTCRYILVQKKLGEIN
jgi:hypothetical protein